MPTIRQIQHARNGSADRIAVLPAKPTNTTAPLSLVKPTISAIEYIVETARPGEVTHVSEGDYYNANLWRCYDGISTRYSCS